MSENAFKNIVLIDACELIGSMFLVIAAVSPVILFNDVLGASIALTILADAIAVGFVLYALIEIFSPICTSYFNPAVCLALLMVGKITRKQAMIFTLNQVIGGLFGIIFAHLMFYDKIPKILKVSTVTRSGGSYLAEILGTFILILAIFSLTYQKSEKTPLVVGLLVGGMLLATSSTMFANPQVTFARIFTYSLAGISPVDGVLFIVMEVIGSILAIYAWKYLEKTCGIIWCKIETS
jgi:glycerol uptake facilitator-like aquaporin